jgi:hypothetical protein
MIKDFTGGCSCGAVHYECSAEPIFTVTCHCRSCQQATGSAFHAGIYVPSSGVEIVGDVKYYDSKGDSGKRVSRGFCPTCGSRLFNTADILPNVIGITAGSITDSSWFRSEMDIYTSSAQPWDFMNPDLPKFPKLPPL